MKTYVPHYYKDFFCIADKCRHSCCIGWEIDIDDNTGVYYNSVGGDFGKRLKSSIENGNPSHFILSENERCPFLNKNNLCDIIINLGEDKLCQICTDHPRFRNYFDSRTEIGLGLCCEAAGRLILTEKKKFRLIEADGNDSDCGISVEEELFFKLRGRVFNILQNRSYPIEKRVQKMLSDYNAELPEKTAHEWMQIFLSLECLDASWKERLKNPTGNYENQLTEKKWELAFEQLTVYFIYRYLADGLYDGKLRERIALAALGFYTIRALCTAHYNLCGQMSDEELIETARQYSSEIEYCEENIETLLRILEQD